MRTSCTNTNVRLGNDRVATFSAESQCCVQTFAHFLLTCGCYTIRQIYLLHLRFFLDETKAKIAALEYIQNELK